MRSKLILIAALLMGIVTTVLFFNYMKQYKDVPALDQKLVGVVTVKQEVKVNTKLTASMLETVEIPVDNVHPAALRTAEEGVGKVTASNLALGEILLSNHLKDQQEEAQFVSKKVKEGYRAVSIGVNIVQSVSNLIEPNDYVDIVFTKPDKLTEERISTILLENVHVLSIGRRMVEAQFDTPYVEYAQVTLELKSGDGIKVINADEDPDGIVSLMLHSRVVNDSTKEQPLAIK
jgi:pilus assembly protein CpaB